MKKLFILFGIILAGFFGSYFAFPVFSQQRKDLSALLTEPYLKFNVETEINSPLNVKEIIRIFNPEGTKAEIKIGSLSRNRVYTLPDASGEICLNAGNCQTINLNSIKDLGKKPVIFIEESGRIGIGKETPEYDLDVSGRIQADGDICTSLMGGQCLSTLSNLRQQLSQQISATLSGEGSAGRIPFWRANKELGNSEIYQSENNIGIGMNPVYKLDVAGTVRMLGFRLPVSPKKGYGLVSDNEGFGTWQPVLQPLGTGADIAENFPIDPDCLLKNNCPEWGDIVILNEKKFIEKSKTVYDPRIIGIISKEPNLTLAGDLDPKLHRPVALIGKVPTKVSLEGGSISPGDFITSSSQEGVGMKANNSGRVVGIAVDSLSEKDFENCQSPKVVDCKRFIGKIDVLVNLTHLH